MTVTVKSNENKPGGDSVNLVTDLHLDVKKRVRCVFAPEVQKHRTSTVG